MNFVEPLIRIMEPEDLGQVLEVETNCFTIPWTMHMFEDELFNLNAHYLVIEVNKKIIGYLGFWKILDEAHITNIAIHSDYRRLGYGKALITALLSKAKELEIIAITLEVRASNLAAISLYESFGFVSSGIRRGYYSDNNEDALIMWLKVATL
ncbi:MAG: ribosomal protein S18-alanine N-acetyltransferase [Clostridiaceae bacterium]|nr:ribosomal protein S18-alanine N-acetyltransferase [Clostridiaceae bacterium]